MHRKRSSREQAHRQELSFSKESSALSIEKGRTTKASQYGALSDVVGTRQLLRALNHPDMTSGGASKGSVKRPVS